MRRLFNPLPLHGIFRGASERALARSYSQLSAGTRATSRWLRARIAFRPGLQQRSLTSDWGQTADKVAKEQRRALLAVRFDTFERAYVVLYMLVFDFTRATLVSIHTYVSDVNGARLQRRL